MHPLTLRSISAVLMVSLLVPVAGCVPPEPAPPRPVAAEAAPTKPPLVADRVVVLKGKRILELRHEGRAFKTFPIALGAHWQGPKHQAGDGRTPEGAYRIDG